MDDFSTSDRLRAILFPLVCCLPTCRLAPSPSSESLNSPLDRAWYEQSTPGTGEEINVPGNWEDAEQRRSRREADLLSLHEGVGATRRSRRGGGDVSGSGMAPGSGLSRWTLLKSWWKGTGAVRLPDSDDEGGRSDLEDGDLTRDEEIADAVSLEGNLLLQRGPPPTYSPAQSEATTANDEERDERRARRRARRAARELGISVEEFDEGAIAEPSDLLDTPVLETPRRSRKHGKGTSHTSTDSRDPEFVLVDTSHVKSVSNGSHGFDFGPASPLHAVGEDEGMDGGDELFGSKKAERRRRRENGETTSSKGSHSASGDGSANGSSRSRSRRLLPVQTQQPHLLSPSLVPLPSSPSASSSGTAYPSSAGESKRPRHRQHPSISSTSTSSSGRRRTKKHRSPLEGQPEGSEADAYVPQEGSSAYYQDEHGQLQLSPHAQAPSEGGQYFLDDAGAPYWVPHSQQQAYFPSPLDYSLPTTSYDHIAPDLLPAISIVDPDPDSDLEELAPIPDGAISRLAHSPDPTSFFQALKSTKLPPQAPVVNAPLVPAKGEEVSGDLLERWEGLLEGKGAEARRRWEGAGEGEDEGVGWRARDSEEETTEEEER